MKISTLIYCTKEGMRNIIRNIWFSLASVAIISACIFLFCMFFGLIANVQYMVRNAESTVGITVFFNEDMSEDDIQKIGDEIRARDEVKEVKYVSAEEAWENFKKEYFKGVEDLAEGFADDNPLAGSASYEIYRKTLTCRMTWLHGLAQCRDPEDQLLSDTASGLSSFNKMLGLLSAVIIAILLAVAIFLISNTITTAAASRDRKKPDHAPDRCDEFHDPCAVRCTGCDDRSGWRADSAGDHVFSVPPGGCIYDGTV